MSLTDRRNLFALVALLAFVYVVGGLAFVYVSPHVPPTLADGTPNIAAAYSEAIQQAAVVAGSGLPVVALAWALAWRCNVRLREDAYHVDILRALAALVRAAK